MYRIFFLIYIIDCYMKPKNLNFKHCINWLFLSFTGTNQRVVLMNGLEKDSQKCPGAAGKLTWFARWGTEKKTKTELRCFFKDDQLVRDLSNAVSTLSHTLEAKVLLWVCCFFFLVPLESWFQGSVSAQCEPSAAYRSRQGRHQFTAVTSQSDEQLFKTICGKKEKEKRSSRHVT